MKLHGMHWLRLLILLQSAKKIEGRSLFTKRSIATNNELPTILVDHLAYEERNRVKEVEDQQESLNTARDVEEQLEVSKTKDVEDQQIVSDRAKNVEDQRGGVPDKLKALEGQPKVRYRFKDVEDHQEMSNGTQNAEYQKKVPNGAKNQEDQQKAPNGAENTKYQQEVTERAKNVVDQKEALKRVKDVGDHQKIPNSTKRVEDQRKVANGAENIEDQQELLEKFKVLEKQQEALNAANYVRDQLEMSNGAQNVEDQQKVLKGARNEEDQQELREKSKLAEQETLNRAKEVGDQQEVIKKAKDEGVQQKVPERVNNVEYLNTSSGFQNVEEKQKNFNRAQIIEVGPPEVTEVAKNVEHQRVVPNRTNNVGDLSLKEITEELILKSLQTMGDKVLDGLLPSNFYNKTKAMAENERNSEYATKEITDKRPIMHAISAENYTANMGVGELHKDESARESLKKMKLGADINCTGAKNLHPQDSITNEALTGSEQEKEVAPAKKLNSQTSYDFENFTNVSSCNASSHALVAGNYSSYALINTNKMYDVQQRYATIPVHIYSTAEEADDHPIDCLSLDIKNIGSNETLKEQLDFLQNNAENIKRQQDIVDEGDVNIIERTEGADKVATGTTSSVTISDAQDGYKKPSVHPNQAEINNNKMKANVSLELPISAVQAIEFNEEAVASYTSQFTASGTEPHESLSYATSNSNAIEVATKKEHQNVSTAAGVTSIELQDSFLKSVTQPLVLPAPNKKVNHIPSINESLELPNPLRQPSESNAEAAVADTSDFGLDSTKVSTNQHNSNSDISKMEASTQNSRIADATAGSEAVFKESTSEPFAAAVHKTTLNYATSNNTSLEFTEPLREKAETNEFITSLTRPYMGSISLRLETNLPKPLDLKNMSDTIVDAAYSDSSTTVAVSALAASELPNYASSPQPFPSILTFNAEDAFSRLTEIFDEYSIPIASVVQQLSSGYEITPVERVSAESIEPTKQSGSSHFQASGPVARIHERPDVVVDSKSPDAADSGEYGYGSGYTILQSQANFASYANLSSSAEQANYEEASDENQAIETAYSQEVYEEEYAEQEENAVEAQLMKANQQSMTTDYQSVANVESEESEYEVDAPSITEEAIANAQTTKTVSTKPTTSAIVASILPLPVNSKSTANEQTNYLEYLKMAIEQFLRKEIENIDKTNESQVQSIHADHSNYVDSQLPAESTNDMPTWETTATGLQHISATHWLKQNKHGAAMGVKGELMRVQMPEVMCSKTGIIKSEQYNKTNENGNGNEIEVEVEAANENENKIEIGNGNGEKKAEIPGRVLHGRSVSYTVSCHIKLHDEPKTITPAVHGTNDTTDDKIDNLQQNTIKNHEQLTITSAADSSNTLQVLSVEHEQNGAETIDTKEKIGWHTAMDSSSNAAYKADEDNSDEGVVVAVDSGSGNYDDASTENSEEENVENFYVQRHGIESEIYDSDAYAASHEHSEASLPAVGIQNRAGHAADVTAFVQSPISLATSNDKTYEYWYHANREQPLQGDGVTDKNATQTSVAGRMATAINSKNTTNTKPTDSGYAVGVAMADEHVTHDYERGNSSDGRHAAAIAGAAAAGVAVAAHVGKIDSRADVDATINVDGFSQMSHLNRPTDKSDISDDDAVADDVDKLHYVVGAGAEAMKLLKIETKSTELENVSAQDTDANNNGGDEAGDNIVAVGVGAEVGAAEAVGAIEPADMTDVNWGAINADTDADVATNAVACATKANTPNAHRE